jgi:hypothetical protein
MSMSVIPKPVSIIAVTVRLASCAGTSRLGGDLPPNPLPQVIQTPQQNETKQAKKRPEARKNDQYQSCY